MVIAVQGSRERELSERNSSDDRFWVKWWLEKLVNLCCCLPYRKPTPVLESSRLRPTREPSLRNSAKKRP